MEHGVFFDNILVKQLLHHMELIGAIEKTHATLHIVGHCKHAEASSTVLIIS
jgi:hypothetical protein